LVQIAGDERMTLVLTTPERAGRTWEVPVSGSTLPLVSNLYLMRDVEVVDGILDAEVDVEPGAAVEMELPTLSAPTTVRLDGDDIPCSYRFTDGMVSLDWQEDPAPELDQDLSGRWKLRQEPLPSLDGPGWKPYAPWDSAEVSGFYHNGYFWYGTRFRAPADGPLHLLLTRFQDDATVYVNGRCAGSGTHRLELGISHLVREGDQNTLHICVESKGRDSWTGGDDHTGLIGPVILCQEQEELPLLLWKRREMPRCDEHSLNTAPDHALPGYADSGWDECRIEPGWDSQIHGRWRDKHFLWYRTTVDVPAGWEGRRIWLDIARAQDTTWVYVDGDLAGKLCLFRQRPPDAFGVDLTDYIRPGRTVTLACCVLGKWVGRKGFYQSVRLCAANDLLQESWLIRDRLEGQRLGMGDAEHDDGTWEEVVLPGSIAPADVAGGGTWWLRRRFSWSEPAGWEVPLGLVLEGMNCKAQVYLNGHLVGRHSPAGPQTVFHLPAPWLEAENQLALALDTEGRACHVGRIALAAQFPVRRRRLQIQLT
jgi:hypothetical protein